MEIIRPTGLYLDTQFKEIVEDCKKKYQVLEDYDSLILLSFLDEKIVLYKDLSVGFIDDISAEKQLVVLDEMASYLKQYISSLKFKLPDHLLLIKIHEIFEKHGKCGPKLTQAETEILKEIITLIR